jgi:hypothetical protein
MRATSTALLALLAIVGVASAQTGQALPRGARVRITPADPSPVIVGQLLAVSDSTLMVRRQRGGGDITIPRSLVQRLEVSRGTNRHTSAGWGALVGMAVGGVVGYASGADACYDSWFCLKRPTAALVGGTAGVAAGSLIGLIVGSVERWRDTTVPVNLSIAPTGGGLLSIGGRMAF